MTGCVAFWIFCVHCLTTPSPFLNPRLLLDRNFTVGTLVAFFMGALSYVSLVLFPGLLHDLRDYPDSSIGLLLSARGCGNWLAFLIIVPFSRRAPRLAVETGLTLQTLAAWEMAQLDINMTGFDVFWTNVLQGFGFGLAYTPMTVLTFTTLPRDQITEGTAVFTLVRNFGSSIFISITVVLLVRVVGIVLVIALLTLPAAVAGHFARQLWQMMLVAVLCCMAFVTTGIAVSYPMNLPSGPVIILIAGATYLLVALVSRIHRRRA